MTRYMVNQEELLNDYDKQLNILLDAVCEKIQLPQYLRERVEASYRGVVSWIEGDNGFFKDLNPHMFPYGSYALGTTNRPRKRDEFDLDFTVFIEYDKKSITTNEFLDKLWNRLVQHEVYKDKIKRLRFCIRIQYDGFHLDIMPGCAKDNRDKQYRMEVPDTKKRRWSYRNLKAYTQWFQSLHILQEEIGLFSYYEERGIIKSSSEPLPQSVPYTVVQPLQKTVQLLKRYRDIYFEDNDDLKTRSIILTTIAGEFYQGEKTIYDSLNNIIHRIQKLSKEKPLNEPITIVNPADSRENFSDKWKEKPKLYKAFLDFLSDLKENWELLKSKETKYERAELMRKLFGKKVGDDMYRDEKLWSKRQNFQPRKKISGYIPQSQNLANIAPEKPWRDDKRTV